MGVITRGILGGFSGKVANVIGGSWKGIAYMRSLPLSVAQPNTAAQLSQRESMRIIVTVSKLLLSGIIKPLMDRSAVQMSGYNSFVSQNIDLYPNGVFDLVNALNFKISAGKMDQTFITTAVYNAVAHTLTISWLDDAGSGYKLATDRCYAIGLTVEGAPTAISSSSVARSALSVVIADCDTMGAPAYAFLAFKRVDGTVIGQTSSLNVV